MDSGKSNSKFFFYLEMLNLFLHTLFVAFDIRVGGLRRLISNSIEADALGNTPLLPLFHVGFSAGCYSRASG
jgi:hypothetical protein